MSYEGQFQSIESVEREITSTKERLAKLVRRRDQLRTNLFLSKGAYAPSPTPPRSGSDLSALIRRDDSYWKSRENR